MRDNFWLNHGNLSNERFILDCLKSVQKHNFNKKKLEHLIIDGGSTDNSIEIIQKYKDSISFWVSEQDDGIYDAMNKGIMNASGNIIGFLNSDDWFYSDYILDEIASEFKSHKLDAVYGDLEFVRDEDNSSPMILAVKSVRVAAPSSRLNPLAKEISKSFVS